jgi:hypothetical protein
VRLGVHEEGRFPLAAKVRAGPHDLIHPHVHPLKSARYEPDALRQRAGPDRDRSCSRSGRGSIAAQRLQTRTHIGVVDPNADSEAGEAGGQVAPHRPRLAAFVLDVAAVNALSNTVGAVSLGTVMASALLVRRAGTPKLVGRGLSLNHQRSG